MKAVKKGAGTAPIASAITSKASLSLMKPKTLAKCLITAASVIAVMSQML